MRTFWLLLIVLLSTQLKAQSCDRALSTPVIYEINNVEYKLTPLTGGDRFESFILQSSSWNFAREFSLKRAAAGPEQEILLVPLDNKHEFYVGFGECTVECDGLSRLNEITIYEGSNLRTILGQGFLKCQD